MGDLAKMSQSRGDVMRRLRELEATVAALTTQRRLEASSIRAGGVTVGGQGAISAEDDSWRLEPDQAVLNRMQVADAAIRPEAISGLRHTEVNGTSGSREGAEGTRAVVLAGPAWANQVTVAAFGVVSAIDDGLQAWVAIDGDESGVFHGRYNAHAQHTLTLPFTSRVVCSLRWEAPTTEWARSALTVVGTFWREDENNDD